MAPTSNPQRAEPPTAARAAPGAVPARRPARRFRRPTASAPWLVLAGAAAGCAVLGAVGPSDPPVPGCPFHALTGLDCPGCGATRGVRQLLRGHPLAALDHNIALAVVVPLAVWAWLAWAGAPIPHPRRLRARGAAVVLALAVAFALVRNLPLPVARWLASGA